MEDVHWLVPAGRHELLGPLRRLLRLCHRRRRRRRRPAAAGRQRKTLAPDEFRETMKRGEQLTPEQNAVVSASVAAAAGSALFMYQLKSKGATQTFDRDTAVAMAAGAVHFCAYAVELRAFRTASSTVITPLLQLSAVWMTLVRVVQPVAALMVSSAGASMDEVMPTDFYVATAAMHPFHFAAIFLIFVGGFCRRPKVTCGSSGPVPSTSRRPSRAASSASC